LFLLILPSVCLANKEERKREREGWWTQTLEGDVSFSKELDRLGGELGEV